MQPETDKAKPAKNRTRRKAARKNITDTLVRSAKPGQKRIDIKDQHCWGFTLRISPNGVKSFAYMGRDAFGKTRTVTIGKYPDLSVKDAREAASEIRGRLKDPNPIGATIADQLSSSDVTVRQLLNECEPIMFERGKKIWAPRGKKSDRSTARMVIECVFKDLLDKPATSLSSEHVTKAAFSYVPKSGKTSANGQASRALSYLRTVFNWASGEGKEFKKLGASRAQRLGLADLYEIADPADLDPKITGKRERLLSPTEMKKVLPFFVLGDLGEGGLLDIDLRPVAMRFILFTLSRRSEVEVLTWDQIDLETRTWTREVKAREEIKTVTHPLSDAAVELLKALPGYQTREPGKLVFPNRAGGNLGNWDRACDVIKVESNTKGWHRHDLRRSASTILSKFGVSEAIIDTLLSHNNAFSSGNTSAAAAAYILLSSQMQGLPDPMRDAVNLLAKILHKIESGEIRC